MRCAHREVYLRVYREVPTQGGIPGYIHPGIPTREAYRAIYTTVHTMGGMLVYTPLCTPWEACWSMYHLLHTMGGMLVYVPPTNRQRGRHIGRAGTSAQRASQPPWVREGNLCAESLSASLRREGNLCAESLSASFGRRKEA